MNHHRCSAQLAAAATATGTTSLLLHTSLPLLWWHTDLTVFDRTHTDDTPMDGTRDAVLHLQVQFWQIVSCVQQKLFWNFGCRCVIIIVHVRVQTNQYRRHWHQQYL